MARFKFSLEKLLQIKKFNEDQKAIDLAVEQAKLNSEMQEKSKIHEFKNRFFDSHSVQHPSLQQLRAGNDYLLQVNRNLNTAQQKIRKSEASVDEKRRLLTLANQEKKSVELLKEKQLLVYKKAENQMAIKIVNEVALRMSRENTSNQI